MSESDNIRFIVQDRRPAVDESEYLDLKYITLTTCRSLMGISGSPGATGFQGDAGPQGAQGNTGPQGDVGPQGAQGDVGPQGDFGATGAQGDAGARGETGPQGIAGVTGLQGATGLRGETGLAFSEAKVRENTLLGDRELACPIWATGANVIYVSSDGVGMGTDWSDTIGLQAGIFEANDGDELWLKQGTYNAVVDGTYLINKNLKIFGGFAGNEIERSQRSIDRELTVLDGGNSIRVMEMNVNVIELVLDTLSIKNGFNAENSLTSGAGLHVSARSTIRTRNVLFDHNISNATDTTSTNGSAITADRASITSYYICDTKFSNNASAGRGASIFLDREGAVHCLNCEFDSNTALRGAGFSNRSPFTSATFTNCSFYNNRSLAGNDSSSGAITMLGPSQELIITNCCFLDNVAVTNAVNGIPDPAGSIFSSHTPVFIRNTLMSGGRTQDFTNIEISLGDNVPTLNIDNSIIENADQPGVITAPPTTVITLNNLQTVNPEFLDPTNGNLRIPVSSPAVNSGDNQWLTAGGLTGIWPNGINVDLDGQPRIDNSTVDIGAYEAKTGLFDSTQDLLILQDVSRNQLFTVTPANFISELIDDSINSTENILEANWDWSAKIINGQPQTNQDESNIKLNRLIGNQSNSFVIYQVAGATGGITHINRDGTNPSTTSALDNLPPNQGSYQISKVNLDGNWQWTTRIDTNFEQPPDLNTQSSDFSLLGSTGIVCSCIGSTGQFNFINSDASTALTRTGSDVVIAKLNESSTTEANWQWVSGINHNQNKEISSTAVVAGDSRIYHATYLENSSGISADFIDSNGSINSYNTPDATDLLELAVLDSDGIWDPDSLVYISGAKMFSNRIKPALSLQTDTGNTGTVFLSFDSGSNIPQLGFYLGGTLDYSLDFESSTEIDDSGPTGITIYNSAEFHQSTASPTTIISNFTVTSDPNGKLVVTIGAETGNSINSILYGSDPLTLAISSSGSRVSAIWYLDNPSAGTADIVVNWSGNSEARIGALNIGNVANGVDVVETIMVADEPGTVSIDVTTTFPDTLLIAVANRNNPGGNWSVFPYDVNNSIMIGDAGSCNVASGYLTVPNPTTDSYSFANGSDRGNIISVAGFIPFSQTQESFENVTQDTYITEVNYNFNGSTVAEFGSLFKISSPSVEVNPNLAIDQENNKLYISSQVSSPDMVNIFNDQNPSTSGGTGIFTGIDFQNEGILVGRIDLETKTWDWVTKAESETNENARSFNPPRPRNYSQEFILPTEYVSVGDQVASTDNERISLAIQEAVDTTHKTVFFPNGTYQLRNAIQLNQGITGGTGILHLVGESRDGVNLIPDIPYLEENYNGGTGESLDNTINLSGGPVYNYIDMSVQNLTIDMRNQNILQAIAGTAINPTYRTRSHGIRIGQGWTEGQFLVNEVTLRNIPTYGIGIQDREGHPKNNITLTNIDIERTGSDGIDTKEASGDGNRNLVIRNVCINEIGFTDTGATVGIDLRYRDVTIENVSLVSQASRSTLPNQNSTNTGISFRSIQDPYLPLAQANLTNIYIRGFNNGIVIDEAGLVGGLTENVNLTDFRIHGQEGAGIRIIGSGHTGHQISNGFIDPDFGNDPIDIDTPSTTTITNVTFGRWDPSLTPTTSTTYEEQYLLAGGSVFSPARDDIVGTERISLNPNSGVSEPFIFDLGSTGATGIVQINYDSSFDAMDKLIINGNLELGGELRLSPIGETAISPGTYQILEADQINGSFERITLPNLNGLFWDTSNLNIDGTISLFFNKLAPDLDFKDGSLYVTFRHIGPDQVSFFDVNQTSSNTEIGTIEIEPESSGVVARISPDGVWQWATSVTPDSGSQSRNIEDNYISGTQGENGSLFIGMSSFDRDYTSNYQLNFYNASGNLSTTASSLNIDRGRSLVVARLNQNFISSDSQVSSYQLISKNPANNQLNTITVGDLLSQPGLQGAQGPPGAQIDTFYLNSVDNLIDNGILGFGSQQTLVNEASSQLLITKSGVVSDLYACLENAPGLGNSSTFTFRLNGVDQGLSTTISDSSTTGNDTANTVAVTTNDLISIIHTETGTPASSRARVTFTITY